MDFWAIVSGAVALLGLLAVSAMRVWVKSSREALNPSQALGERRGLPVMIAVAIVLLAIGVPNVDRVREPSLASAELALKEARTYAVELPQASQDPLAQLHLKKANAELWQASEVADLGKLTPAARSRYWASIQSASSELQAAKTVDPSLAENVRYSGVARRLEDLGEAHAWANPEATAAGQRGSDKWRSNPNVWMLVTFIVAGLFLCSVIGIVVLVAVFHRDGKPDTAKRWLRTYSEPIGAGFAMVIGLLIALNPGLDHATTLWGAGVAGSGMGFWIKMSV